MTEPSSKIISEIIEKFETLKSKQTDFINKKTNKIGKAKKKAAETLENADKPKKPQKQEIPSMDEILTGKPARKLTFTEEAINNLQTEQVFDSFKIYEKQRQKPKEYWPEDVQSLIDEIEILMYPYDGIIRRYGESLKMGLYPVEYIIQEMRKISRKIEVKTQQKSAEAERAKSEPSASDKGINPFTKGRNNDNAGDKKDNGAKTKKKPLAETIRQVLELNIALKDNPVESLNQVNKILERQGYKKTTMDVFKNSPGWKNRHKKQAK